MAVDHEAPYAALAARIQTYCGGQLGKPVSRKLSSFDQIGQAEHPAICVVSGGQLPRTGGPESAIWLLTAAVFIYARGDADPGGSPEPTLNRLIGAVEAALERQPDEVTLAPGQQIQRWTTLGGTCVWAQPVAVEIEDGAQGNEGIAVMRVDMLIQPV